jgi:two-component system, NtrC family, C4-dicarboxylate transport sensor histidine kinase DctB
VGSPIGRAFDRWIEHQDESFARAAASPRAWLTSSLFVCAFLPVLAWAPGAHDYFGLRVVPALLCYLPGAVLGIAFALRTRGDTPFSRAAWLTYLLDCAAVQFFCASLMAWCSPHGAAAISSLFIFAAAYHGHLLRVTPTEPFLAIGTVLSALGAALLDPSGERRQLIIFAAVAALTAELLVGMNARQRDVARRRTDQLRAALNANILDEKAREVQRLADTLVDVLGRNHDVSNALMALRLTADAITFECERARFTQLEPILVDLQESMTRLSTLVERTRTAGRADAGREEPEPVEVLPLLDSVLRAMSARFPSVRHKLIVDRQATMRSPMRGGGLTLRRIFENLLVNACEGDGVRGAGHIEIEILRDSSGGRLQVLITDDGPGFKKEQLAGDIEVFASSKPQGSGLGLYTCERLLHASGGQLQRANAPGSGAQLRLILPLERS